MIDFAKIYNEYERTKNVCQFCSKYAEGDIATRFLLIRSLDSTNLKDIIRSYSKYSVEGHINIKELTEKAYNSSAKISDVVEYIESKRSSLISQREEEVVGLQDVLSLIPIVNCGVRNDKVDDIVKTFVRNKSLKTIGELNNELDNNILPRVRKYSLWSYYNQTSNDIVELFLLKHSKVIPTLRKIHDIDFFLRVENKIIPFDIKFTHISDSYFDLASKGIVRDNSDTRHDDFYVNLSGGNSEVEILKDFYKGYRRKNRSLNLPKIGDCDKSDIKNALSQALIEAGDLKAINFIEELKKTHQKYVPSTESELHSLEWWNYKYQGERLFCNNNRLFVFLAYRNKFTDGRELKGKTEEIGRRINLLLDNVTLANIHTVKYHYDKDSSLEGDYTALAMSTIYAE